MVVCVCVWAGGLDVNSGRKMHPIPLHREKLRKVNGWVESSKLKAESMGQRDEPRERG